MAIGILPSRRGFALPVRADITDGFFADFLEYLRIAPGGIPAQQALVMRDGLAAAIGTFEAETGRYAFARKGILSFDTDAGTRHSDLNIFGTPILALKLLTESGSYSEMAVASESKDSEFIGNKNYYERYAVSSYESKGWRTRIVEFEAKLGFGDNLDDPALPALAKTAIFALGEHGWRNRQLVSNQRLRAVPFGATRAIKEFATLEIAGLAD